MSLQVLLILFSIPGMVLMFFLGKAIGEQNGFKYTKRIHTEWMKLYDKQNVQWNELLFGLTGIDMLATVGDGVEEKVEKPKATHLKLVKSEE